MLKKLRDMEETMKSTGRLLGRQGRAQRKIHTNTAFRFVVYGNKLHLKMIGAGSKGAKTLAIDELNLLTDRHHLIFLTWCILNDQEPTPLARRLYE